MPKDKPKKNKGGRKGFVFTDEDIKQVKQFATTGLTDEQIWTYFGIGKSSFYAHLKKNLELANALKRGRVGGVAAVAGKLFTSAMSGNTVAQLFYLKCKGLFREVQEHKHSGDDDKPPIRLKHSASIAQLLGTVAQEASKSESDGDTSPLNT